MQVTETYKAVDVARFMVDECFRRGEPVGNLHLQRMLYVSQLAYDSLFGRPLFGDEFEAWPYGPVVRPVYAEYSRYGGSPIRRRYDSPMRFRTDVDRAFMTTGTALLCGKAPWDLVKVAQSEDSPWAKVYGHGRGIRETIPNCLVMEAAAVLRDDDQHLSLNMPLSSSRR